MKQIFKLFACCFCLMLLQNATPASCLAMDAPETVDIDILARYYEPVLFDHTMHVDMVGGSCASCHHHTTGQAPESAYCSRCHEGGREADEVACQSCHEANRFEASYLNKISSDPSLYHVDKVGLKAAYHLKCLGCHRTEGAPTGCQDCHARTEAGDEFFHAGQFAPEPGDAPAGHH